MENVDSHFFQMVKICHPIPGHQFDNETKISTICACNQYNHVFLLAVEHDWTAVNSLHVYPASTIPMDFTTVFTSFCLGCLYRLHTCITFLFIYKAQSK